jgi:hypothetical protein
VFFALRVLLPSYPATGYHIARLIFIITMPPSPRYSLLLLSLSLSILPPLFTSTTTTVHRSFLREYLAFTHTYEPVVSHLNLRSESASFALNIIQPLVRVLIQLYCESARNQSRSFVSARAHLCLYALICVCAQVQIRNKDQSYYYSPSLKLSQVKHG